MLKGADVHLDAVRADGPRETGGGRAFWHAPLCTVVPVVALGGVVVELFSLVVGWPFSTSAGSSTCCCKLFASKIGIEAAGESYRA
jgi:hypothetical protein